MKLLKNSHFRTIIITKRIILMIVCGLFIVIFGIVMLCNQKNIPADNQYTLSEDFHNRIIASQLHNEKDDGNFIKNIAKKILGFDIGSPETILENYSEEIERTTYPKADETVYPKPANTPVPTPSPVPPPKAEPVKIEEKKVSKGLSVSNATEIEVDANALAKEPLSFTIEDNSPQVLIVHTHTTESYTDISGRAYAQTGNDRTTDETQNIIAVGKALREVLVNNGINTIHDTTVHDYPSYNGAYTRSKATVLKNLEKYPSIKIVLDVHRDGIVKKDGTKVKLACDVGGEKVAQCMFVVGSDVELKHDFWRENMKLACRIQSKANEMHPDFMRPVNLRKERFNQQLSKGALIIEVGSNGNTLNEALAAARVMGEVIAKAMK